MTDYLQMSIAKEGTRLSLSVDGREHSEAVVTQRLMRVTRSFVGGLPRDEHGRQVRGGGASNLRVWSTFEATGGRTVQNKKFV